MKTIGFRDVPYFQTHPSGLIGIVTGKTNNILVIATDPIGYHFLGVKGLHSVFAYFLVILYLSLLVFNLSLQPHSIWPSSLLIGRGNDTTWGFWGIFVFPIISHH